MRINFNPPLDKKFWMSFKKILIDNHYKTRAMDQTRKSVKPKPVAGNYLSCRKSSNQLKSSQKDQSEVSALPAGWMRARGCRYIVRTRILEYFLDWCLIVFCQLKKFLWICTSGGFRIFQTGSNPRWGANLLFDQFSPKTEFPKQFPICTFFFSNLGVTHTHKFYNCDVKVSQAEIHCWTYYERMLKSIDNHYKIYSETVLFQLVFTNT